MRKPKSRYSGKIYSGHVSPHPQTFSFGKSPQALKRQPTTASQKRFSEGTIIWGDDDAMPLRMANIIKDSPATSACLNTKAQFIKGSKFSNDQLMRLKINRTGQTLWDLHCYLADTLALFEGFSVDFRYNSNKKITNAFPIAFESCRFKKPENDLVDEFDCIVYNPYIGTDQYNTKYSKTYPLFNLENLGEQLHTYGPKFPGQVYYYSKTKPLYRFYSNPDYWSAKKWIEIDAKIQEFHAENLDNGFFQSVLMTVIGNPNELSTNPKYQETYTDENGVKRTRSTKTVGEEFNEMMSESFSGSKKAGNIMVQWALNQDQSQKIQAFPNNTNADLFIAIQNLATKNLTIATEVPAILANISEGVNLGSGGSEIQKSVELMQSRAVVWQNLLMQFYNETLLPNFEGAPAGVRVEIVNFKPVSEEVVIDDKFWAVLTPEEQRAFVKKKFPEIQLIETTTSTQPAPGPDQQTQQKEAAVNTHIKDLTGRQFDNYTRIIARYHKGKINYDQAFIMLKTGFAFTDYEIKLILNNEEEDVPAINSILSK